MIAFILNKFNRKAYKNYIDDLEVSILRCSCGCKGSCIKYGKYKRKFVKNDKISYIYIQRIYCKSCLATNALLPVGIVPYHTLCLDDMMEIIETYEDNPKDTYDTEANRVIKRYKIWKERLNSIGITFKDELIKIISFCALNFRMCFMQSKRRKYRRYGKLFEVTYKTKDIPT